MLRRLNRQSQVGMRLCLGMNNILSKAEKPDVSRAVPRARLYGDGGLQMLNMENAVSLEGGRRRRLHCVTASSRGTRCEWGVQMARPEAIRGPVKAKGKHCDTPPVWAEVRILCPITVRCAV